MNSRNVNNQNHHRRGHSFNSFANINVLSNSNSSHGKLGKLSFESGKLATTGIDDLLSSTEGGKHDYDWLLTPPGTPNLPSSRGESQPTSGPQKSSLGRPMSNTNGSRLSVSQSENNNHSHSRPSRSSSVTRSPNRSSSNSILNISPASLSSHTRPSSPITRSPSAARPSTPTSRSTTTSTPPRVVLPRSLPNPTNSSSTDTNKTRTPQVSRPSTPSSISRPSSSSSSSSIPTSLHTPRSLSRPSTPTRRHSLPSPSPPTTRVGRNSAPRPQPIVPADFPLETPPNLRTTLPADRPVSAGMSRPGAVVTLLLKTNSETVALSRRQPSPIANRGRLSEHTAKSRGHASAVADAFDVVARKSVKPSTTASDINGLGRTISKKSLDMAIGHMDVRNSSGNIRSLSSATLYPQSIRTSTRKTPQHTRGLNVPASLNINGSLKSRNNRNDTNKMNGIRERDERKKQYFAKKNEVDVYESYRYDSLLLKEDLNNTNWLHSVDEKCDQGPIFDNGFESLPEPFGFL